MHGIELSEKFSGLLRLAPQGKSAMAASMAAAWTNLAREHVCGEPARFRCRPLRRCKADGCDQGGARREQVVAARSGGAGPVVAGRWKLRWEARSWLVPSSGWDF